MIYLYAQGKGSFAISWAVSCAGVIFLFMELFTYSSDESVQLSLADKRRKQTWHPAAADAAELASAHTDENKQGD